MSGCAGELLVYGYEGSREDRGGRSERTVRYGERKREIAGGRVMFGCGAGLEYSLASFGCSSSNCPFSRSLVENAFSVAD